jgi:uncharacterized protein with GYD domain
MATFIMTGKYSADAVRKISGSRTSEATAIIERCGGRLVGAYATLGEKDLVAILELPGIAEAMKASVELNAALGISFATTPALPMEAFDRLVAEKK